MRWGAILVLGSVWALAACGEDDEVQPGGADPCLTPASQFLGCPPQQLTGPRTVEQACLKLATCGLIDLDVPEGQSGTDFNDCVRRLQGSGMYTTDRLELVLRCVEVSPCQDLRPIPGTGPFTTPCFVLGGEPP